MTNQGSEEASVQYMSDREYQAWLVAAFGYTESEVRNASIDQRPLDWVFGLVDNDAPNPNEYAAWVEAGFGESVADDIGDLNQGHRDYQSSDDAYDIDDDIFDAVADDTLECADEAPDWADHPDEWADGDEDWGSEDPLDHFVVEQVHPQFHLFRILEMMAVARGEVARWRRLSPQAARAARNSLIDQVFALPAFTARWTDSPGSTRSFAGIESYEAYSPAEEAHAIALAVRSVLEHPGSRAVVVTPDRELAQRVYTLCSAESFSVFDARARSLSATPVGMLLLALANAAEQPFEVSRLSTLLRHPLVQKHGRSLHWYAGVGQLEAVLAHGSSRRPLQEIDDCFGAHCGDPRENRQLLEQWWQELRPALALLDEIAAAGDQPLPELVFKLRNVAEMLSGIAVWSDPAGQAVEELITRLGRAGACGPSRIELSSIGPILQQLMDECKLVPPTQNNSQISIFDLANARTDNADFMVIAGLNEAHWPGQTLPPAWLSASTRALFGLRSRAQDMAFASCRLAECLGAPRVLLTRSLHDARGATKPSQYWVRLEALANGMRQSATIRDGLARSPLDRGVKQPRSKTREQIK